MNKKKQLKIKYPTKSNFMPKLSLWLIVIVPIIIFDKFVDVMSFVDVIKIISFAFS